MLIRKVFRSRGMIYGGNTSMTLTNVSSPSAQNRE